MRVIEKVIYGVDIRSGCSENRCGISAKVFELLSGVKGNG
jgi:hypothetical protein